MSAVFRRRDLPWGGALLLVFLTGASLAWCPEAPLLAEVPEATLKANLASNRAEVFALLGSLPGSRSDVQTTAIGEAVDNASRRNGLPPELILAVIGAESSFEEHAVSNKGARGLMQLMPGTAAEVASQLRIPWTSEAQLYDPAVNITMGAFYLTKQLSTFRDLDVALAAYNRGPAALPPGDLGSWNGETGHYVRRVRSLIARHADRAPARDFGGPYPFAISSYLSF